MRLKTRGRKKGKITVSLSGGMQDLNQNPSPLVERPKVSSSGIDVYILWQKNICK